MREPLRWAMRGCLVLPFKLLGMLLGPVGHMLSAAFGQVLLRMGGEPAKRRRRAQRMAALMLSELARLGFTRKLITGGQHGRTKRQRIRWEEPLLMTVDELWCPIDHASIPTGINTDELRDESVIRSLTDRCDCAVRVDYLANGKMCYVVRYGGATFPDTFSINAVEFPENASALSIPAGVNADGTQVLIDLDDVIHLLVAGATGNGKTVFIHAALTTLINRNTADDLELWLVDLKQTEFALYRSLWSKKGDGIVREVAVEPEAAIDLLNRALAEINRRNALMVQHGCTSFDDLNQSTGIRLRKAVIVLDEFAQLTLNTTKLGHPPPPGLLWAGHWHRKPARVFCDLPRRLPTARCLYRQPPCGQVLPQGGLHPLLLSLARRRPADRTTYSAIYGPNVQPYAFVSVSGGNNTTAIVTIAILSGL